MFEMRDYNGVEKSSKEYNAIMAERNRIRRKALDYVIKELSKTVDDYEGTMKEAIICLQKKKGGNRSVKLEKIDSMFELIGEKISEKDLFLEFGYGRNDMKRIIKELIIKKNKWIKFYPVEGYYKLEGYGKTPPKDWSGIIPKLS